MDSRSILPAPRAALLWLPALGVPARKYERFAAALGGLGVVTLLHEWRGTGAHPTRPSRREDWGYAELLHEDIPASLRVLRERHPGLPLLFGGHSIGAQFAVLTAALHGGSDGLLAVGGGVPYWRLFPAPMRWLTGGFGYVLPPLTRALGHYPGDALGFAGREAGQLMRDWAQTVRHGNYDGLRGLPPDFSARIAAIRAPLLGLHLVADRLVPQASLDALLGAAVSAPKRSRALDAAALGCAADHFAWMRSPEAVAREVAAWWDSVKTDVNP